jgi:FAD/FMN-containing dehydrogenase
MGMAEPAGLLGGAAVGAGGIGGGASAALPPSAVRRKFWGWGLEGEGLTAGEVEQLGAVFAERLGTGGLRVQEPPRVEELDLRTPRLTAPAALEPAFSTDPYDRAAHTYGRSFRDLVRAFRRDYAHAPDLVAFPRGEDELVSVLEWCSDAGVAAIPFGGGSSVAGGVEPDIGDGYRGAVSVDLRHLQGVLEVDRTSRAARIAAGTLGVITEAWMRVQPRPRFRAGASVSFASFADAVQAARELAQSGLHPANCRLLGHDEALLSGSGDGSRSILLLGFESADHELGPWLARALEICASHRGEARDGEGDPAAAWRASFLRGGHLHDGLVRLGLVSETFETAITWDRFWEFHEGVLAATRQAVRQACGGGMVSCRFAYVYPDGPAPYYSVFAPGRPGRELEQWDEIKTAASEAIAALGGTITHHHAVGRDHRRWYLREVPPLFADALRRAKAELDPAWIMNPGVLLEPAGATTHSREGDKR